MKYYKFKNRWQDLDDPDEWWIYKRGADERYYVMQRSGKWEAAHPDQGEIIEITEAEAFVHLL